MDSSKVLFRNKGRGYNKDDVNEYIAAENKRFADAEATFKRALQEKDRVIEGFNNELYKCNNENYLLKNSLAEKDKTIDSLNTKLVEFENTVAELREKITKLEDTAKAAESAVAAPVSAPIHEQTSNPAPAAAPVQTAFVPAQPVATVPAPVAEAPAPVQLNEAISYASVAKTAPEVNPEPITNSQPVVVPQRTFITRKPEIKDEQKDEENIDSLPYDEDEDLQVVYKKAEAYDRICDQIDEILNHAKIEADHIISTAIEASRKMRSSRNEIDLMKRDITGRSTGIIGEIKKSVVTKRR